jgi:hypothetical protein
VAASQASAGNERRPPPAGIFVSLAEQLDNVRRWSAMRRWGFTEGDLASVDLTPATHDSPLVVDLIAVYLDSDWSLDGVRRTCDDLWLLAADQQPNSWCWDDWYWDQPDSGLKPVRLADGITHRPGVRRVTVDLGAHWVPGRHIRPIDVRGVDSAHAEVLAAAAHFPRWVRAMDGATVPYTWLAGYQVTVPRRSRHLRVPCLSWTAYRQMLSLTSHEADYSQPGWAAPACIG